MTTMRASASLHFSAEKSHARMYTTSDDPRCLKLLTRSVRNTSTLEGGRNVLPLLAANSSPSRAGNSFFGALESGCHPCPEREGVQLPHVLARLLPLTPLLRDVR
eukprot:1263934-Pyramimonas_sp.AAC.2